MKFHLILLFCKCRKKNGEKISEDEYSLKQKQLQINTSLEANESEEYIIKGVVNAIPNNKEAIEINNITKFNLDASTIEEKNCKTYYGTIYKQ